MIASDGQAPYAPPAAVAKVIERHRQVAIAHFDTATLERIGVSASLAPRTMQSLRILDLVAEDGSPTEAFERLRKAPTPEYKSVLEAVVREAYRPVLDVVDGASASVQEIEDAFRHFKPAGQRGRMVTLFVRLLELAGVRDPASGRGETKGQRTEASGARPATSRRPAKRDVSAVASPSPTMAASTASIGASRSLDAGDSYRVELDSGGSITMIVDVKIFGLSADDRDFVIDLVDRLRDYDTSRRGESAG